MMNDGAAKVVVGRGLGGVARDVMQVDREGSGMLIQGENLIGVIGGIGGVGSVDAAMGALALRALARLGGHQ